MYVILEMMTDSEYSEGEFKFCGIYENLKQAIELLQLNQLCTQININETISDQIGPEIKCDEFVGGEKLVVNEGRKYKVNDPQIIRRRGGSLIGWRIHEFKYYYNFEGRIYTANHILFNSYDHNHHKYADHLILLDD